jgi:uncharacterized protein YigE (DUF2233 family)
MSISQKVLTSVIIICVVGLLSFSITPSNVILSHTVDLKKQDLKFYWKNDDGKILKSFKKLDASLKAKNEKLVFAMNGGMYKTNHSPLGLYIENGKELSKVNSIKEGYGNFYMQPNGIFYITDSHTAVVCKTPDFKREGVKYATQSGPMLLINGKIHDKFKDGSKNLNIRNGVGILPNGSIVFGMSKDMINFYDFASYFKSLGCENALYLDGFVSKTYLPSEGYHELKGNFGVIIGEIEKQ